MSFEDALSYIKTIDKNPLSRTDSSGSSIVLFSEFSDKVYQYFKDPKVYKNVLDLGIKITETKHVEYRLYLFTGFGAKKVVHIDTKILINNIDYITKMEFAIPNMNTICYEKIQPLTKIVDYKDIISKNLYKLCYDISKALYFFHKLNFLHNDTVIDNIGISKSRNFVLFDFDGSGTPDVKQKDFSEDFKTLCNSIEFHTKIKISFESISDIVIQYAKKNNISHLEAYSKLEKLEIEF